MDKEHTLGVIGAGQIGRRHLQSLAMIDRPTSIQVVDTNPEALAKAKEQFNEIKGSENVKSVEYLNTISNMTPELDWVVIATTSEKRREVIESLLTQKKVKYLLLEKVLFQKLADFSVINSLLKHYHVKTWVNFARRMWPIYRELRGKVKTTTSVSFNAVGSQWGLGCNGLHLIDLFAYFTNDTDITFLSNLLDTEIIASKRPGYVEFTGTLYGSNVGKNSIMITSYSAGKAPFVVQITNPEVMFLIKESEGKAWIAEEVNNWKWHERSFTIPYQSLLTHLAVQQILDEGQCFLTSYEEAWKLHIPFIEVLLAHLRQYSSSKVIDTCPIT